MRDQTSTLSEFPLALCEMHGSLIAAGFRISLSQNVTALVEIDVILGLADV